MPASVVVESVTKTFPCRGRFLARSAGECVLSSVSLQVESGSVLALLGRNGSGKTTLLKLIASMLLPDCGSIRVGGCDTRTHGAAVRRQVGFAIANERSFFARLTANENLDYFAALEDLSRPEGRRRIRELLARVGLEEVAGKLVREFSAGMYQRLAIARALLKRPSVLLLDEPSRSLDPSATLELWQLVRESAAQGTAVIIASQSFDEIAQVGDGLVMLDGGVVAGQTRMRRGSVQEDVRAFYFACMEKRNAETECAVEREA